ncbi:hypothetical protein [Limosilactobacillus vaginalis]|uniref:hypothetical protein n=1 Tax=Limosilactobacillus vaginalis TaxID=1633 RepID=UPI002359F4EE|nr:hypothetical protein [Limosilactobacillus vaginalis]WCT58687.1 hypothetical protein PRK59_06825 [Limosilactobacillus vaginalis]
MSQQKTCGKLAISPDEGDLRLGRRLLTLASLWRADLNHVTAKNLDAARFDLVKVETRTKHILTQLH